MDKMIRFIGSVVISLFLISMPMLMIVSIIDHCHPFIELVSIITVIAEVIVLTSSIYYKNKP